MDAGFYHPELGYWQSTGGDPADLLPTYPEGTIQVSLKPGHDYDWRDGEWVHAPAVAPIPDRVTARQFKLQLLADELIDGVEGWIATQPRAVQIAYETSGTFVRDEPMMQAGFAALGFAEAQVDEFFVAAAVL